MSDIILDACMKFENYPIKTVGDAFYNIISKFQKIAKNSENSWMVKKKAQAR